MGDIIETANNPARRQNRRTPRFAKCKPLDRHRT